MKVNFTNLLCLENVPTPITLNFFALDKISRFKRLIFTDLSLVRYLSFNFNFFSSFKSCQLGVIFKLQMQCFK